MPTWSPPLYRQLMRDGRLADDWFARQVAEVDRTDGDIDTLSTRIAQVRTWTFVANRPDWLRRSRALAGRHPSGRGQAVGCSARASGPTLRGSPHQRADAAPERERDARGGNHGGGGRARRGTCMSDACRASSSRPIAQAGGPDAKALRNAAAEGAGRRDRDARRAPRAAPATTPSCSPTTARCAGRARWSPSSPPATSCCEPRLRLLADEQLTGAARDQVQARLDLWLKAHVEKLLGAAAQARGRRRPDRASPAASPSRSPRRSACSSARASPTT